VRIEWGPRDLLGARTVAAAVDDSFRVQIIGKARADSYVKERHYSRSVVWSSSVHFGVFLGMNLMGVLQFGPAMNPGSGSSVVEGSTKDSWLELNRMVLDESRPTDTASRAISGSIRLIRHLRPSVEWIQSFADERCGKLGAVYQAASFVYCGSHASTFYLLDGEWFHKSMKGRAEYDKRGWWSGPKVARFRAGEGRAEPHTFNQHRYIKFLDQRARKRLLLPVLPYPKPHPINCDLDESCQGHAGVA
jgi:hypothetical protein